MFLRRIQKNMLFWWIKCTLYILYVNLYVPCHQYLWIVKDFFYPFLMYMSNISEAARFITSPIAGMTAFPNIRSPTPAGAPLILAPRMPTFGIPTSSGMSATNIINGGGPPPLVSPTESNPTTGLVYNPYAEYPSLLAPGTAILEYPHSLDQTAAGMSLSYVRWPYMPWQLVGTRSVVCYHK